MKNIIIHAWTVHKQNGEYFLPYTHWIYLQQIVQYYDEVCLLSPVNTRPLPQGQKLFSLAEFDNVWINELPHSGDSYIAAARHFISYYGAYKKLHTKFDKVYVRYPVPFGWLSRLFFKADKRTIHFVGYPLEVAKLNPEWSRIKKLVIPLLFMPEHMLYVWACKNARVFTNGHHISDTLAKKGVNATAVTSSTLTDGDFYFDTNKKIEPETLKLLHIGYLRKWKIVDVIIKAFALVQKKYPQATLTIVGDGVCRAQLEQLSVLMGLGQSVRFEPHASRREDLLAYLRSHDIFCFSSISEGSPRVILEAMANGINVVSTPVGSLPFVFKDNEDIVFADFNNEQDFAAKIIQLAQDEDLAYSIRYKACCKTENFTIETFIRTVFGVNAVNIPQAVHEV